MVPVNGAGPGWAPVTSREPLLFSDERQSFANEPQSFFSILAFFFRPSI